jgi:hypothetical protein
MVGWSTTSRRATPWPEVSVKGELSVVGEADGIGFTLILFAEDNSLRMGLGQRCHVGS